MSRCSLQTISTILHRAVSVYLCIAMMGKQNTVTSSSADTLVSYKKNIQMTVLRREEVSVR
jgi:hypothetical protein